ncbi:two-component regulator propeller domain-containing protein [Gracilimonas sp.]|uniref:ligand-binding sensor domain-containing protein n=1 Tax=Gracilimonas sp. TaxID=1974203 RepID=UPI0032ED2AB5
MIRKGILFFALLFIAEAAFAFQPSLLQRLDTLTYREWSIEDGLPVNTVNSITQDSLGYLWISTYDGLVRFDGLNFKTFDYSNTPEMPHNRATLVHRQNGVGMWFTLEYGGVLLYQNGNFKHYGTNNGFTNSDVTKIYEVADGRMFFVTHRGLYVYEGGAFSLFYNFSSFQNQVSHFLEDNDGSFWISTNDGLLHHTETGFHQYDISDNRVNNQMRVAHRSKEGALLVGTVNGLYELKDGKLILPEKYTILRGKIIRHIFEGDDYLLYFMPGEVYIETDGKVSRVRNREIVEGETYTEFYEDSDGNVWMLGNAGSLGVFKNGRIEKFNALDKIKDYYFNSMFEDREGNLWFATNTNGLITVSKSKVRTLGSPEGLSGDNILALFKDSRDAYWVGTRGAGLNKIEGDQIVTYQTTTSNIASNIIHAIEEDGNGNIWVGYYQEGLDLITQNGFKNYRLGTNVEVNDVRSIFNDSNNQLWVGTYGGLVKFDPVNETHQFFGIEEGMAGYKIRYITEDSDHALWIGTLDGGVSRFKNGDFRNYTTENGLSSNNIRSVYVDEKEAGVIWVGTENNGLNRIKNGEVTFINTRDGLPDHIVHWISQDQEGWLWISSNRGIIKIDKSELNTYLDGNSGNFTLLHYGRQEGMRNPEANGSFQEAGIRTHNGDFWFSTQEGVAIFQSEITTTNNIPPTVLIKNVRTGNLEYNSSEITIEKGYKAFDISFHALTFVAPEKTRFRYRLKGYDDDWIEVFGERTASYADVPAGNYTFEVIAANNDGVWSKNPAIAAITVQPFFYEQAWFYFLLILLVGGGYYGASKIRYQYLIRKQQKMEKIIEEQTAQLRKEKNEIEEKSKIIREQAQKLEESNKTKDKFFSLIAHDLRNPFQAILGYSEMMITEVDESDPEELKTSLQHIHASSKSLLTLVEHLLNWASLHTGKISPVPEKVNLRELIERMHQLFEHVANQKNISLQNKASEDAYLLADLNMLETILRNLISNAIKFTREGGTICMALRRDEGFYYIEVEDDGIGMSEKLVNELLRLDSTTSRAGTRDEQGTGLGLLICKEMMNLHNGEILIESEQDKGTKFTLKFPIEGLSGDDIEDKIKQAD